MEEKGIPAWQKMIIIVMGILMLIIGVVLVRQFVIERRALSLDHIKEN